MQGSTSIPIDDLVTRIRAAVRGGTVGPDVEELRHSYDEHAREVNRRLRTAVQWLRQGLASEALHYVECYPDSLAAAAALEMGPDRRRVQAGTTGERVTTFIHDTRGRVIVATNPQSPHSVTAYDERGRVTATATYSSTSGLTASAVPTTTTNRLSYSTTLYDRLNRPYETRQYRIAEGAGTIVQESSSDIYLRTQTWYDSEGRVIKTVGSTVHKTEYDRLGRAVRRFTIAELDDSGYGDAGDVDDDAVVEEARTIYDNATGLVLATGTIQRNYDQTGVGALDTNADADDLAWTAANITGRIQITSMWYDTLDRLTTTAFYGTNHASNNVGTFDRDGLGAPSRSDDILVTTRVYNDNGTLLSVTDPKAIETRYFYDPAHRQTHVISNYVNGTPSGVTGDDDNFVRFTYAQGLRTEMWVDLDGDGTKDGDDQVTTYDYGVTTGSDPDLSLIDVNNLLYSTTYPDSASGSDKVFHSYNAQGERIRTEDQIGDVLVYTYDTAGRQTSAAATLAGGSPTDNAILRIETAYTDRGQVLTVTSYDAASSGTVQNEVKYDYDDWGNLIKIEQDRDSAVGGGGTGDYEVAFTYAEGGPAGLTGVYNRIHRTAVVYPDGTELQMHYGSDLDSIGLPTQVNYMMGRVERVDIEPAGGSPIQEAGYEYLGMGHVVRTDLYVPAMWSAVAASSSAYPDLDRFNRIVESSWTWDYITGTDYHAYELDLTYDRNSNITWAEDQWHNGRDVLYSMDGLNRLGGAQRGDRSGSSITLENFHQEWTLDQTGNWELFKNDLNGDNDWGDTNEVEDNRSHNTVNELETRNTNNTGGVEHTLTYTAAGQLADDDQHYEYIYDAWGRLVEIEDQSSVTVTQYEYNGLGHRIGARWDIDADLDLDWEWLVYDDKWRVVARFGNDSAVDEPTEQIYHHYAGLAGHGGSSYIDLVIARERIDWSEESPVATRDYVLQNWRADVVALAAPDGDLLERITYDAYGIPFATYPTDLTTGTTGGVAGYGMPSGVVNNDDYTYFLALYAGSNFRADWNRDGTLSAADNTAFLADHNAATGSWGRGVLSNRQNILGYAGYVHEPATGSAGGGHGTMMHVRNRVLHAGLGRWTQRDPAGYEAGSLVCYGLASPTNTVDPMGLRCLPSHGAFDTTCWPDDSPPVSNDPPWIPSLPIDECAGLGIPGNCGYHTALQQACKLFKQSCASGDPPTWTPDPSGGSGAKFCCLSNSIEYGPNADCTTFAHELIHAADACHSGLECQTIPGNDCGFPGGTWGPDSCRFFACTEARGNSISCCRRNGVNGRTWEECMEQQRRNYDPNTYRMNCPNFGADWDSCVIPKSIACDRPGYSRDPRPLPIIVLPPASPPPPNTGAPSTGVH